ncbi:MAG: DUF1201 domain-containing protein [Lentimicrobiaceae bacterium]|nr:DUF1201 domain-containing protein [Lentimicrobiaceae bacterium]
MLSYLCLLVYIWKFIYNQQLFQTLLQTESFLVW